MNHRARVIPFPRRRPEEPTAPDDDRGLVRVHRGSEPEALVVKALLESEGILAILRTRVLHSVHPFTVGDQGEVAVLVPSPDAPRARRILTRVERDRSP